MGWVNDRAGRDLGVLGVGGSSSSESVTIQFQGEEFLVPVVDGYFAWIRRDVPAHVVPAPATSVATALHRHTRRRTFVQ